jgi:cysteine-rich repeat protein
MPLTRLPHPLRPLTAFVALIGLCLASACGEEEGGGGPGDVAVVSDTSGGATSDPDATSSDATDATFSDATDATSAGDEGDTSACVPVTCESAGVSCGRILNGCGGSLSCGNCRSDEDCVDSQCVYVGCRITECALERALCGSIPDGCGDDLDCGDCDLGFECTSQRQCIAAPKPVCGNGVVEFGEDCDNGLNNSNFQPNACRRNCRFPSCGDGVRDANEACDDGNTIESDACRSDCTRPAHCRPCSNDSACGGGRCLNQLSGACGVPCDTTLGAAACPSGYSCQSVGNNTYCMPAGNVCQEICDNGFDDDGDGRIDCADSDCTSQPYCGATEFNCFDGIDNDGNGLTDCLDSACFGNVVCACANVACDSPPVGTCLTSDSVQGFLPGTCGVVNGSAQCNYPSGTITCNTPPPPTCNPGNDSFTAYTDGANDCSGGRCSYASSVVQCNAPPAPQCSPNGAGIITFTDSIADCTNGACAYASTTTPCDTPPLATCSGNTATVFASTGTCAVSGGSAQCTYTSSTQDCAALGRICGPTGCEPNVPVVAAANYPIIALGGKLVLTGSRFTGATSVTIGGVPQAFTVDSPTQVTINAISDSTPIGNQQVVVSTASAMGVGLGLKVIRLVINELDCDQPKVTGQEDRYEFIEVSTGLNEPLNLSGYVLVTVGSDSRTYNLPGFDGVLGVTGANGLLLIGTTEVSPPPTHTFTRNNLRDSRSAVAIYQRAAAPASSTSISTINDNIIDALVYSHRYENANTALIDVLIGPAGTPGRVQASEGGKDNNNSIRRCGNNRRDGSMFSATSNKTPGAANTCP